MQLSEQESSWNVEEELYAPYSEQELYAPYAEQRWIGPALGPVQNKMFYHI
jgi:hypothetical protein